MENAGINITRIFDAPREQVWQAWTNPDILMKWWGPEGFYCPSAKIDLRVGGKYIYTMHGPSGSQWDKDMYSAGIYREIVPNEKLVVTDFFSDDKGNKVDPITQGQSADMPDEMDLTITFEDEDGKTKLTIFYPKPAGEAHFEAMKNGGMETGWNSSLNKLQKLLTNQ